MAVTDIKPDITPHIPQRKSKPFFLVWVVLVTVVVSLAVYFLVLARTAMVTDHWKYYPKTTTFYAELELPKPLRAFFYDWIGLETRRSTESLSRYFKPMVSFGLWTPEQSIQLSASPLDHSAIVLSTQKGIRLNDIARLFYIPPHTYRVMSQDGFDYLMSNIPQSRLPGLALHQQHLLITPNHQALRDLIANYQTQQNVLNNSLFKNTVALLPQGRKGTFISLFDLSVAHEHAAGSKDPYLDPLFNKSSRLSVLLNQIEPALSVSAGSITVADDHRHLELEAVTPIQLHKILNPRIRQDVRQLMAQQTRLDVAKELPKTTFLAATLLSPSDFIDLYMTYGATDAEKNMVAQLKSSLGEDASTVEKDLSELLKGQVTLGLLANQSEPVYHVPEVRQWLFLIKHASPLPSQLLQRLERGFKHATDAKAMVRDIANHKIHRFEGPRLPVTYAYSRLNNTTLVIGTEDSLMRFYQERGQSGASRLATHPMYQRLLKDMPVQGDGLFYLNLARLRYEHLIQPASPYAADPFRQISQTLPVLNGVALVNTSANSKLLKTFMTLEFNLTHHSKHK